MKEKEAAILIKEYKKTKQEWKHKRMSKQNIDKSKVASPVQHNIKNLIIGEEPSPEDLRISDEHSKYLEKIWNWKEKSKQSLKDCIFGVPFSKS